MLMNSDTVLEVERLSKIYSRSQVVTRKRLANTFTRSFWGRSQNSISQKLAEGEFWSLNDITFSLKRGEALGVIGFNGAGKTTLLRLLSGQLLPDRGEIRILGKTAAMIDLTAGFQMTANGHRNIYLRGAMLGRSQEEIDSSCDEIISFAELGEAINAPVSTYSSGMLMRLAFSIMVAMKPDVLFIDEILSVGDFRFRQKCLSKIRQLRESSAFVLVSHSMEDIKNFCNHAIVLHEGGVFFSGEPEDAIAAYEGIRLPGKQSEEQRYTEILSPQFHNKSVIKYVKHFWCDSKGDAISEIKTGHTLYLKVSFMMEYVPRNLIIGVPVWSQSGTYITGFSSQLQEEQLEITAGSVTSFTLEVPALSFNPDDYISNLSISDGVEFLYRGSNGTLTVTPDNSNYWGVVTLPHKWRNSP